jgi:AcrR family transcriptional regulator
MSFADKLEIKALELFMRYGIKSVSMDDLAKSLGISKKTIYAEVANKETLLARVMERFLVNEFQRTSFVSQESLNAITELIKVANLASQTLESIQPVIVYDLKKYFPEQWEMMHQLLFEHIYEVMLLNIQRGRQEGLYSEDFNEDIVCRLYVGNVLVLFDEDLFPSQLYSKTLIYKEMIVQYIRSICNQKGIDTLLQHDADFYQIKYTK